MPILNWLTRDQDIGAAKRVPYRLFEEAAELSAGDPSAGNMLIQGDNLEALKALLPFYAGQVKCIYIDPPYNTRSAFARHPQSFWLPTASDKFYPDFVAQLNDGRFFVVEYKGALLAGAGVDDTNEKRAIGRLWESRSDGKGVFLVVEKVIDGRDMRVQMLDKVGGAQ